MHARTAADALNAAIAALEESKTLSRLGRVADALQAASVAARHIEEARARLAALQGER